MAQSFHLREQTGRCRRLAHDCTDPTLRDSPLKLAEEYVAAASAQEENDDRTAWQAGSDDQHD